MFYLFLVLAVLLAAFGVYHLVPKNRILETHRGGKLVIWRAAISKPRLGVLLLVVAFLVALVDLLIAR